MGEKWKQWQTFISLGSPIIVASDYSHEIKRCLLPGRKAMTNLDSILKSRDITLPTKVHLVKAMFFPVSWLFTPGGQSIETSASASVLAMNIQGWFPLGWIGLISLLSKGLSRVFSNTTVEKHQFFGTQPSLCSNSYIHTWLLEKT